MKSEIQVYKILNNYSNTPWYTEKLEPSSLENKIKLTIFRQGIYSVNNAHFTYKEIIGENLNFDLDKIKIYNTPKEPWMSLSLNDVKIESSALRDTIFHHIRENIGQIICPAHPGTTKIGNKWP